MDCPLQVPYPHKSAKVDVLGGWGMGIDRITMFLTDSNNIKEVLLFPAMVNHSFQPFPYCG